MSEVRIGTSGWHYKHWRGPFYPEKLPASKMLPFYFERFDTVEVNNSFYHLPSEAALCAWRETTPDNFLFAVKGSRFLTHMKKLKDPEPGIEKFFARVDLLEPKLGPILFQLPPFWELNLERLEGFLKALGPGGRYAFEFRNPTWHVAEVYRTLERYNAAFCPWDLAGVQSPIEVTADWAYVRLHGPSDNKYQGSYSQEALAEWARRIDAWRKKLAAIYVYFDNDIGACAVENARELKGLLLTSGT